MVIPLAVGREKSMKALEIAMTLDRLIFVVTQRNSQTEDPVRADLYEHGTVGEILQLLKMPDGTLKILVEAVGRARLLDFRAMDGYAQVDIQTTEESARKTAEFEAMMRHCRTLFEQYVKLHRRIPLEVLPTLAAIDDPARLADVVASHLLVKIADRQELLELADVKKRLERLVAILEGEIEILNLEKR